MPNRVFIETRPTVDFDDKIASESILADSMGTALEFQDGNTYFRTRTGRRAFLTFVGNQVSPGGEDHVTFHILVNGNPIHFPPLNSFTQSLGETYNGWAVMSARIPLPENAMIEVTADNADTSDAFTAYARLRVEYEDPNG